jgi:hypothetical protein
MLLQVLEGNQLRRGHGNSARWCFGRLYEAVQGPKFEFRVVSSKFRSISLTWVLMYWDHSLEIRKSELQVEVRPYSFRRNLSPPSWGSNKPAWTQVTSRRWYVPPKRRLTFNGLHGVVSERRELFTATAVRTSDPTYNIMFYIDYILIRGGF